MPSSTSRSNNVVVMASVTLPTRKCMVLVARTPGSALPSAPVTNGRPFTQTPNTIEFSEPLRSRCRIELSTLAASRLPREALWPAEMPVACWRPREATALPRAETPNTIKATTTSPAQPAIRIRDIRPPPTVRSCHEMFEAARSVADVERSESKVAVWESDQSTLPGLSRGCFRPPPAALTARQTGVLELMAQGRSNAAIAEHLTISEKDHRRVLAIVRYLSA